MRNVLCCRFNFYDGPPFATGLPHYGHILAGTIKDIVTRFAHQSGFHVDRRFGWDCHGLPVVCAMNLPADTSLGFSFPVVPYLSLTFLLLLYLALLLKEKFKFLSSVYLWLLNYIYLVHFSETFFLLIFLKDTKETVMPG